MHCICADQCRGFPLSAFTPAPRPFRDPYFGGVPGAPSSRFRRSPLTCEGERKDALADGRRAVARPRDTRMATTVDSLDNTKRAATLTPRISPRYCCCSRDVWGG